MFNKRIAAALLCTALMCQLAACGGGSPTNSDTTVPDTDETAPAAPVGYPYYEGNDLGGETFTVLNVPKMMYSMIAYISPEEQNGEVINDAIYNRNEFVMDKLNCEIEEINVSQYDLTGMVTQAVMSGDDIYDAVYERMYLTPAGIAEGYYYCLNDIDTIHLGESWWDPVMLEATSIGQKSYFATSSAHLVGMDSIWCLFFNESMMDDLGLTYPYQLVRDGKWTLDEMQKYTSAAANLNGASDFSMNGNSPAIYGCTSFADGTSKFIYGVGGSYFSKDKNDMPVFNAESERFVNSLMKLSSYLSTPGEYLRSNNESIPETSYITYFKQQKALFLAAETKAAQTLRDMEQSFGIIPFPKADDAQENYQSTCMHQVCVFTIPTTNPEPEKVGLLFDALSWESDDKVLDTYFGVTVEQKGLRNEESIEMLKIIKETRSVDIGIAYQWAAGLEAKLVSTVFSTTPSIASHVATYKESIITAMNKTIDAIKK